MAGAALTPEQYNDFIRLLEDFVKTQDERRALIQRAFGVAPVVHKLDYSGSGVTFCSNALDRLYAYDRETAIIRLLETVRDHELGPTRRHEAETLIRQLLPREVHPVPAGSAVSSAAAVAPGAHVFISYSRDDAVFVSRLRADLDARGIPYWIDKVGLVPGTADWEEGLRTAIAQSRVVILVATPISRKSPYVRDEIAIAQMYNKRLIPLWTVDQPWMECVPVGLGYVQHIDMRSNTAYQAGIAVLIAALDDQTTKPPSSSPTVKAMPKNPYKGLMAFDETDSDKFFGRKALIESLIDQLTGQLAKQEPRFLAVLGPSGAGKSSVVRAGLIPALKGGKLPGSKTWTYLPSMFPGAHPIESLAEALKVRMPDTPLSSIEMDLNAPGGRMLQRLAHLLPGERVLLYIDQFEELFTLTGSEREREQFISLISQGVSEPDGKLVVLLSMRADFLNYPLNYPLLGDLLGAHNTLVKPLTIAELYEAVENPARLPGVGLTFDQGLVAELVYALRSRDEGALASALPLLQFTLERLYEERDGVRLTWTAYNGMGGVAGAIGTHSEAVFTALPETAQAKLEQVFVQLVSIDEGSEEPTRRRAKLADVGADPDARLLVEAMVNRRLLQTGRDGETDYLEIAHEALLHNWERLVKWIDAARADLITLRRMEREANAWQQIGRPTYLLPSTEEIRQFEQAVERLGVSIASSIVQDYIEREEVRLVRELLIPQTPHERRRDIGDHFAEIGDPRPGVGLLTLDSEPILSELADEITRMNRNDLLKLNSVGIRFWGERGLRWGNLEDSLGLPDIVWQYVDGGKIEVEGTKLRISPFFISRYPVTVIQFRSFWNADDNRKNLHHSGLRKTNNYPVEITYYEAVDFCNWFNMRLGQPMLERGMTHAQLPSFLGLRLPTEWEWEWAANGGNPDLLFPWGNEWEHHLPRANTQESRLNGVAAVGLYPNNTSPFHLLDMSGNVWEWCINSSEVHRDDIVLSDGGEAKLCGGSWNLNRSFAYVTSRHISRPTEGLYGFRPVMTLASQEE